MFKCLVSNDYKLVIEWHYQVEDEDTLEAGEEIAEMVDIKINFISFL